MEKVRRLERLVALTKMLSDHPGRLFPLNQFGEMFGSAKSTLSEDMVSIREALGHFGLGTLETVAGAAGGIRYWPVPSAKREQALLEELAEKLSKPERILPGGYLYMSDVLYDTQLMSRVGEVFVRRFLKNRPDYIMTVETKGIPLAMMTARSFDVPVIVVRRETRVTEGPTVNINYVSGSSRRIQTMSVGKRSLRPGSRVLIMDDFMKAGATAKALVDLAHEMDVEVVGTGMLMVTSEPKLKLFNDYETLLKLKVMNEETGEIQIEPCFK